MLARCRTLLFLISGLCTAQTLEHVQQFQNMQSMPGQAVTIKRVACQAKGKPETLGVVYLMHTGRQFQVARIEYNSQGKYILDGGKNTPKVDKYFNKYVTQQQPFSQFTMNAILGIWRLFGMHFSFENVTYFCQMTSAEARVLGP